MAAIFNFFQEYSQELLLIAIGVGIFIVQLLFCLKAERAFFKLLPVLLCLLVGIVFLICTFAVEGWNAVGFLILALYSGIALLVCGAGWIVFGVTRIFKR